MTRDSKYDIFAQLVEQLHGLEQLPFVITYTDPVHGDLLPINNNDNFVKALSTARPLLKLLIQRKGTEIEICLCIVFPGSPTCVSFELVKSPA